MLTLNLRGLERDGLVLRTGLGLLRLGVRRAKLQRRGLVSCLRDLVGFKDFALAIDLPADGESRRCDRDFANATVHGVSPSRSKTPVFQFGDLPADSRVVAARELRELDDADRPAAFDPDQEHEE